MSASVQDSAVLTDYKSRVQRLQMLIAESRSREILTLATSLVCAGTFVAALTMALKGVGFPFRRSADSLDRCLLAIPDILAI